MFRKLIPLALTLWLLAGVAVSQTRSEFFSRDLSFSFKDTDRFSPVASDKESLLHLVGPGQLDLKITKKKSAAKSLTEISEAYSSTSPTQGKLLSNRMTSVGSQLATVFELGESPEKVRQILAVVLRDGQEYWFEIDLGASETTSPEAALALLDQIEWKAAAQSEAPQLEFRSTDKAFTLFTSEDFRVTYNPHAVLSLANLEEVAVVVTKAEAKHNLTEIYDGVPRSLPSGALCKGRMMLALGTEQAASFVIEGMFPPQGPPTHQTLMAVVVRDGVEYDFMVHYPVDNVNGMEDAHTLLSSVVWQTAKE